MAATQKALDKYLVVNRCVTWASSATPCAHGLLREHDSAATVAVAGIKGIISGTAQSTVPSTGQLQDTH